MKYEFAPLEGLTTHVFRQAHSAVFPPPDCYFTPFLALTKRHTFSIREREEIACVQVNGINVVPQVLTNDAEDFLWAAGELVERGFTQVNLNMGCPSGTVVAKGKGAGLLRDEDALRAFLDTVFDKTPLRVSVKTRLGLFESREFEEILPVLLEYPFNQIIVHPRVQNAFYAGTVDEQAFVRALACSKTALTYNGDLFSASDVRAFSKRFTQVQTIMLGRGALANPAIFGELAGGMPLDQARLSTFHDQVLEGYIARMGPGNALMRMKELWIYMICAFEDAKKQEKRIRKAKKIETYREAVKALWDGATICKQAGYHRAGFESAWTRENPYNAGE